MTVLPFSARYQFQTENISITIENAKSRVRVTLNIISLYFPFCLLIEYFLPSHSWLHLKDKSLMKSQKQQRSRTKGRIFYFVTQCNYLSKLKQVKSDSYTTMMIHHNNIFHANSAMVSSQRFRRLSRTFSAFNFVLSISMQQADESFASIDE